MKEKVFTNHQRINVILAENDGHDQLIFEFETKKIIDLNSDSSQNQIQSVFASVFNLLTLGEVELTLEICEGYSKALYIEVCKEFITEINREITSTSRKIHETFLPKASVEGILGSQ